MSAVASAAGAAGTAGTDGTDGVTGGSTGRPRTGGGGVGRVGSGAGITASGAGVSWSRFAAGTTPRQAEMPAPPDTGGGAGIPACLAGAGRAAGVASGAVTTGGSDVRAARHTGSSGGPAPSPATASTAHHARTRTRPNPRCD